MILRKILAIFICSMLIQAEAGALTIVQLETQLGADPVNDASNVYLALFEDVAPQNVANFLDYVNRGDYNNMFFHRIAYYPDGRPFVVQGGRFTYTTQIDFDAAFRLFPGAPLTVLGDPSTGEVGLGSIDLPYVIDADRDGVEDVDGIGNLIIRSNSSLQLIPLTDVDGDPSNGIQPPVVPGEVSLSNSRGTIAMALNTGPDSATNEWFVNVGENGVLDTNSGGFTAFGEVMGNGMAFFDTVNSLVIHSGATAIHEGLVEMPVYDHPGLGATRVYGRNLARLNTVSEVLHIDITEYDFGLVDTGALPQVDIAITNRWNSDIEVGLAGTLTAPYSASNNCFSAPIASGATCLVTITFAPTATGSFVDVLEFAFINPDIPNISVSLAGEGVATPPRLTASSSSVDFQYLLVGSTSNLSVTLTNHGYNTLTFGAITTSSSQFSQTNTCVPLNFGESCIVDIVFAPVAAGSFVESLVVNTNDSASPLIIDLLGVASSSIDPEITVNGVIEFGDTESGLTTVETLTITNTGKAQLDFSSVPCCGINGTVDFQVVYTSCGAALQFGSSCEISLEFHPQTRGEKSGTLKFLTNDPIKPEAVVNLVGTSSIENDGVYDLVEDAAPNGGDGNMDGVPDSIQMNVVSIVGAGGEYLTLATEVPDGVEFLKTKIISSPSSTDEPDGLNFNHGYLSYEINGRDILISDLGYISVALILPLGKDIVSYYQYGPTPDNSMPHWYEFLYDSATDTGAQKSRVIMVAPDGTQVERDLIIIRYKDGGRGDNDLAVNGVITNIGGSVVYNDTNDAAGLLSIWNLLVMTIFLKGLRKRKVGIYKLLRTTC